MGTGGKRSQWCNRLLRTNGSCGRFCFAVVGRKKRRRCGGEGSRLCRSALRGSGRAEGFRIYKWCPAAVSLECECGERLTLTPPKTTCARCGADHTDVFEEVLETHTQEDEGERPWHFLRSYFTPA